MSNDAIALIGPAIPVSLGIGVAVWYFVGYSKTHGGVGFFQWRRVLKNGATASAKIAAKRNVRDMSGGRVPAYVTEYLLDVTHSNGEKLRASVTLPLMWYEQQTLAELQAIPVRMGEGIVVIDMSMARDATERDAQMKTSAEAEAFDRLRNEPPT